MTVLIADTSVLIDLERAVLLPAAFALPETFAVPDLLYTKELADHNGPQLLDLGLQVMELDEEGVLLAQAYAARAPISAPDAFALTLAKVGNHTLLTGDGNLRRLALAENVLHHGVLWMFDRIELAAIVTIETLKASLSTLANHPQCRLPKDEIKERLQRYGQKINP